MELDQTTFEQIESYLEGNGSAEMRRAFEDRMAVEETFRLLVETQREIQNGIRIKGDLDLKKKLNRIHDNEIKEEKELKVIRPKNIEVEKSRWNKRSIFSIAASILFLLFSGYFLSQSGTDVTEDIYASPSKKAVYNQAIVAKTWSDQQTWENSGTFQVLIFEHQNEAKKYTFDGQTLALFNNNSKEESPLELYQIDGLILKWKTQYYQIKPTQDVEPLILLAPNDLPDFLKK